ncbi:MAG: class I SAM-dependent methyltransferase [Nanoarchaeota archaeon]|nr:class I SAM-dependent methyltransferase [Nanoarchaeota archaeon]
MDPKEYRAGQSSTNFWHRCKNDLIGILMSKATGGKARRLKILNIGVGTGDDLKVLNRYGDNYIVDINKEALDLIDRSLYLKKAVADACRLPYEDGFFDIVVSFDVFEHIEDDKSAAAEAFRVLKKGGTMLFSVPAFPVLFSSHDKAAEHKRRYDKRMLRQLFNRFGNTRLYYWNSILFLPWAALRLMKKRSKPKLEYMRSPSALNRLFYPILRIDNYLIKNRISPLFGLTIIGHCRK